VTATLRHAILHGYFEPGEKVDVEGIAQDLGVSRMPVREAIRRLESERLVTNRAHHGATITTVTQKDIHEIYVVRMLLEVEAIRTVARTIPDKVLDDLDRYLDDQLKRLRSGDSSQRFDSDAYVHQCLLEHADNSLLKEVLEGLTHRVGLVRYIANLQTGPHEIEPILEHKSIISALRQRDPDLAAREMYQHLEKSSVRVKNLPWVTP
jgi:DNA-binding GntR family transcriptional regulator